MLPFFFFYTTTEISCRSSWVMVSWWNSTWRSKVCWCFISLFYLFSKYLPLFSAFITLLSSESVPFLEFDSILLLLSFSWQSFCSLFTTIGVEWQDKLVNLSSCLPCRLRLKWTASQSLCDQLESQPQVHHRTAWTHSLPVPYSATLSAK